MECNISYVSVTASFKFSSFKDLDLSSYEPDIPTAADIGIIELIIAPKVPPSAKALMPKKINTKRSNKIIINVPKASANKVGEIPNFSKDIEVFLSFTYLKAYSNSSWLRLSEFAS